MAVNAGADGSTALLMRLLPNLGKLLAAWAMQPQSATMQGKKADSGRGDQRPASFLSCLGVLLLVGWLQLIPIAVVVALCTLPSRLSVAIIVVLLTFMFLPIQAESQLAKLVARFMIRSAVEYFPIRVVFDDREAIDVTKPYLLAAEPHSVAPFGLMGLLDGPLFPGGKFGISSAAFKVPFLRHVWSWVGVMPASKEHLLAQLTSGKTACIVPGGVQECFHLEDGCEVLYLKQRLGFVKLAMETGAPLVPVFLFGQTSMFRWWIPRGKWNTFLSRQLRIPIMAFWGINGTAMPYRTPVTLVIGKPIPVGDPQSNPPIEQIREIQAQFIAAMEDLFLRHRVAAGHAQTELKIR